MHHPPVLEKYKDNIGYIATGKLSADSTLMYYASLELLFQYCESQNIEFAKYSELKPQSVIAPVIIEDAQKAAHCGADKEMYCIRLNPSDYDFLLELARHFLEIKININIESISKIKLAKNEKEQHVGIILFDTEKYKYLAEKNQDEKYFYIQNGNQLVINLDNCRKLKNEKNDPAAKIAAQKINEAFTMQQQQQSNLYTTQFGNR